MAEWWESAPLAQEETQDSNWYADAPVFTDRNPDGTYGQPPEGFVFNPDTGQMEDVTSPLNPNIPQGALNAAAMGGGQGLGFGFLDEAVAAASVPFGGDYNYNVARMREADRRASEDHPYIKTGSQIAGGVTTALGAGGAGLTLLGRGVPATMTGLGGVAARTGVAGLEGAAYGGLDALGNDTSVAMGLLTGGAFGAGANLIGEGIQAGVRSFRGPEARAQELVSNAAGMDALTPEQAAARLQELGPNATIADLGPNMRGQASALATRPGEAQSVVRDSMSSRSAGSGARISQAVDDAMGGRQNVIALTDDIAARRSATAKPLYEASRDVPVQVTDDLRDLLSRPSVKDAISTARRAADDAGEVFDLNNMTVGMVDRIKKALDDPINVAFRAGENNKGTTLNNLKNKIVDFADSVSPDYAQARRVFSDDTSILNALEDGVKAFDNKMTPDALSKYLSSLDEASREAYVVGARQKVANTMGTARNNASSVRSMFNREYNAEKLRILLGDEGAETILNSVSSEDVFQATKNAIMGGSDTIPKGNAQSLIAGPAGTGGPVRNLLNMRFGDAATALLDSTLGDARAHQYNRINEEVAKLLMSTNTGALSPVEQSSAVRDIITRSIIGSQMGGN